MSRPRASLGVPPNDLYIEPVPWPRIGQPPKHDADACTVMALFDESKENPKHVRRALKENARQGFWNGPPPPPGYRVVAAGRGRLQGPLDPDGEAGQPRCGAPRRPFAPAGTARGDSGIGAGSPAGACGARHEVVTHVLGTFCHPCLRVAPF